jgi:hypothetical protein
MTKFADDISKCDGKQKFSSFLQARNALKRSKAKDYKGVVYTCSKCHKFHIGTSIVSHGKVKKTLLKLDERKLYGRSTD